MRVLSTLLGLGAVLGAVAFAPIGCESTPTGDLPQTTTTSNTDASTTDAAPAPGDDGGIAQGCDGIQLDPPASGVQYEIAQTLGAGQEQEVCQMVELKSDMDFNWTDGIMSVGAHHALVYRTAYNAYTNPLPAVALDGETIDGTTVHPCSPPSALWAVQAPFAGARYQDGTEYEGQVNPKGVLPPNVAYKFKAGDYLLLDFHMLNATSQTLNVCYKANLVSVPDSQVDTEASLLFWYNSFITVPANGMSTARMACPITSNINLASAVSHAHARLVDYTADLLSGDPTASGTTTMQTLYTTTNWDLPTVRVFGMDTDAGAPTGADAAAPTATPIQIQAGQWIDYHCDYQNTSDLNIAQGLQTTDEMCMFVGAYWPRDPLLDFCLAPTPSADAGYVAPPADAGSTAQVAADNGYIFGYGTQSGADFLSCFWQSPQQFSGGGPSSAAARYASDSCITQTCPQASPPIVAYTTCLANYTPACTDQCSALQGSFQDVCAATPASSPTANDGCQAEYGTDGTDGTCASNAEPGAITACTSPVQVATLTDQCKATLCAAYCGDAGAPPAPADAGADAAAPITCDECVGTFTASAPPPTNPSCLNSLTFACIADQAKSAASACVTQCFTNCITTRATSCTVDCLNGTMCAQQYDAVASATCN
jgi:Copper type II ascorbate-dependent monooxygenase, C-terminal domain